MKKRGSLILLILSVVFGSFCMGYFFGRNYTQSPILVSAMPLPTTQATTQSPEAVLAAAPILPEAPSTDAPRIISDEPLPVTDDPLPSTDETQPPTTETQVPTEPSSIPTEQTQPTTEPTTEEPTSEPETSGLIDINTATQAQLMTLPGIGEALSQRIIDYREANGPFRSVSELLNVSGIGEKRLAAILDSICVGG